MRAGARSLFHVTAERGAISIKMIIVKVRYISGYLKCVAYHLFTLEHKKAHYLTFTKMFFEDPKHT